MRMESHRIQVDPIPIITKIILGINIVLFCLEVFLYPLGVDLVANYCLSPALIIHEAQTSSYTLNGVASLFLSNLFHANPWSNLLMGIMHIGMNMMVLLSIGKYLEKQFGARVFANMTLFFLCFVGLLQIPIAMILEYITMDSIPLLSTKQCGVGYSAVLFAYFMVYLRFIPNDYALLCGYRVKKWIVPFVQLVILSLLLHASFVGHLSGIIIGLIYVATTSFCTFKNMSRDTDDLENVSEASDVSVDPDAFDETDGLIAL